MIRFLFLIIYFFGYSICLNAQVSVEQSLEFESSYFEENYNLAFIQDKLAGFRVTQSKDNNSNLEVFVTDKELKTEKSYQIPIQSGYSIAAFDVEKDLIYLLLQQSNPEIEGKYLIYELNLESEQIRDFQVSGVLNQSMLQFQVFGKKAVFIGYLEELPNVQILDLATNQLQTLPGIQYADTKILNFSGEKNPESFTILLQKEENRQQISSLLTLDFEGNPIQEIKLSDLLGPKEEIREVALLNSENNEQTLVGTIGNPSKSTRKAVFITRFNEFGEELDRKVIELKDLPNYYDYLPESKKRKILKAFNKSLEKGQSPEFENTLMVREIRNTNSGILIYLESISARNKEKSIDFGLGSDLPYQSLAGVYVSPDPRSNIEVLTNSLEKNTTLYNGIIKFHSGHFIWINKDGEIVNDYSLSLNEFGKKTPDQLGKFHLSENTISHLYLHQGILNITTIQEGKEVSSPKKLSIIPTNEELIDTRFGSEHLFHWYENYYLVSSKEIIKSPNAQGENNYREVFTISKIKIEAH